MRLSSAVAALLPLLLASTAGAAPLATAISTDGTLGQATTIAPDADGVYSISSGLGTFAGANLFHSFSEFEVATGDIASFTFTPTLEQPVAPARVIARVTGGDGTSIFGTLRSEIPDADLFLLDPKGVEFGNGSRLEVQGSFYTSSADVLRFEEGPDFRSGDGTTQMPALSFAAPEAFGFLSAGARMLVMHTSGVRVDAGKTLSIVGGDVTVGDSFIDAPGANLEIAATAGAIDVPVALAGFDVAAADPDALGGIDVIAGSDLWVSGEADQPAGSVTIRGGRFTLSGAPNAGLQSGIWAEQSSGQPAAGPVDIAVSGELSLVRGSFIRSNTAGEGAAGDVLLQGDTVEISGFTDDNGLPWDSYVQLWSGESFSNTGDAPDLRISGRVVNMLDGGRVEIAGVSAGPGSNVDIQAGEEISIAGPGSGILAYRYASSGAPGTLSLDAPRISIARDGQVASFDYGAGLGAGVEVRGGRLELSDRGAILGISPTASQGGLLDLSVDEVSLTDGGRIFSGSVLGDAGGDIQIEADRLTVSDAGPSADPTFIVAQNGGAIHIDAGVVELDDGGQIVTRTFGDTPAGPLSIANAERVTVAGENDQNLPSAILSRSRESASAGASGGLVSIDTVVLEILDGGEIDSSTFGAADAGAVDIHASERLTVQGGANGFSRIFSGAVPPEEGGPVTGAGGLVAIDAGLVELRDGGQVSTTTIGTGDAGAIDVRADRIEISGVDPLTELNQSGFYSNSNTAAVGAGSGDGGQITLQADEGVFLSDQGTVSATATGTGLAGSIDIDGGKRIELENATITTSSLASAGGKVKLTADKLVYLLDSSVDTDVLVGEGGGGDVTVDPTNTVLNRSSITARAQEGPGGNILIVSDYYFQSGESFLDPSSALGIDGTVEITSPDTDLTGGLITLPASYLDASRLLERDCAARTERAGSFAVRARAPLAAPPDQALTPLDLGYCDGGKP